MYADYWQLDAKPFPEGFHPRTYYPAEAHQGALLKLRYALDQGRPCVTLTGPSGSGKTMLTQLLLSQLGPAYEPTARMCFPVLPANDLLAYLAEEIAGKRWGHEPSPRESLRAIEIALDEACETNRTPLLVLDEAQLVQEKQAWEYLRLLLSLAPNGENPLRLLLVGQTTLLKQLERMPGLDERVAVKCQLAGFDAAETAAYVQHQLLAAGAQREFFDQAAYQTLFELTQGIPRRINRLCDLALMVGYAQERRAVTAELLETVHGELLQAHG